MSNLNPKTKNHSLIICWILFLLTFVLVFVKQKWMGYHVVVWDIRGYYAYLPAAFIHGDLKLSFLAEHPNWIEQRYWPNQTNDGDYVIKMTMGMSILYLPYFLLGHLWAHIHTLMPEDGFSQPYQIMLSISGPIHLLFGMLALRKFLKEYFDDLVVGLTLILIVAGTNAAYYAFEEGPMSHIHNFMLYAFFLRLTQLWHKSPNWKYSIYLGLVSGLIALIRPNNVIIGLLFIFYDIGSLEDLKIKARLFLKHWTKIFSLLLIAFMVLFPQLLYWKYVTGDWVYYSYQNKDFVERFFFDRPRFALGLFSYCKGWLVYTPLASFGLIGIFMLYKKATAWRWIVPIFLFIQIYVILSWWCWWYGGGFSQRAFIDFYPVLALGVASFLSWLATNKPILRYSLGGVLTLLLCLNMFQTWQYSKHLIRWSGMSRQAYWSIFLKTEKPKNFDDLIKEPKVDAALKGEVDFWGPDSLRCY
jgi:hypothetical protein